MTTPAVAPESALVEVPTLVEVNDWIDKQKISRLQILILGLCGAAAALEGFDAQSIGFVAPSIIHEWGLQPTSFTPAFAIGLMGLLTGCLLVAPLADRFGRKTVIVASSIAFGIFSLLTIEARSLESLSALRFLTDAGLGGGMANAIALTSEYFPARKRAAMTVVMFCGFPLGASLGGFLAAAMIPAFGWRSVFILGGVLPLLLAVVLMGTLPESIRHLVLRQDLHREARQRIAAILRRINPLAAFTENTVFTIAEERRSGITVRHLFGPGRSFGTLMLWTMFFMNLLGLFLLTSWLPTLLHDDGLSISMAVIIAAVQQGSGVISSVALGPLLDRRGCLPLLIPLYLLAGVGFVGIGLAGSNTVAILIAAAACGMGNVTGQNVANALAAAYYPTYIRATGVGWALGIGRIGAVVGPVLGGVMLGLHWHIETIFLIGAVPSLIAVAAVAGMAMTTARRPAEHVPVPGLHPSH